MITTPCSRVFDHWSIIETCAARALPTHPASCSIKILPILALHGYLHGYGSIPTIEPSDHPLDRQKSRSEPQCVPQLPKHTRASRARKHASTQRTQARKARKARKHASTQVHTAGGVHASKTQIPPPRTQPRTHAQKHTQIYLRRVWPAVVPSSAPRHPWQLHGSGHTRWKSRRWATWDGSRAKNVQETRMREHV